MPSIRAGSRIIALWPDNLKTDLGHTKPAFDLIDPEWVTSAPSILRDLHNKIKAIKEDKLLSPLGQKQNIEAATRSAMNRLKSKADSVKRQEERLREQSKTAVEIPSASQNDTLIDIAMAGLLRQQVAELKEQNRATTIGLQRELDSLSERAKLAVLRLPSELCGLNGEMQEYVRSSFVPPAAALEMRETYQAVELARNGVQAVLEEMISMGSFPTTDAAEIMGETWNARTPSPVVGGTDMETFKPARVKSLEDAQARAAAQAEAEVSSWVLSERLSGREVTDAQKLAKTAELTQLGLQIQGIDKVWTPSDKLGDAKTAEDRQAIIQARMDAQKAVA